MTWAWRRHNSVASFKRTLLPLALSLVTFSAFAIAGVFSSRVATSRGGEVLIAGSKCAIYNNSLITYQNFGLGQAYLANRIRSSANYASSCYTGSRSPGACRTFIRDTLPFKITRKTPCPFPGKDRICHSSEGAIRLDSGLLNSHFDLGINSPPSARFLYRAVNECVPLRSEGFTYLNSSTSPKTLQFRYGSNPKTCKTDRDGCTWELNFGEAKDVNKSYEDSFDEIFEYNLKVITHWDAPLNTTARITWEPIPELSVSNADVSVIFLKMDGMKFYAPVKDPWFNAEHGPFNASTVVGKMSLYSSDQPARALACVKSAALFLHRKKDVRPC